VRRRGFTYVEMLLVILVMTLIAGLVMPNLIMRKKSRDEWKFRQELRSLGKGAKSRATEIGRTVSLSFDKTQNQVQIIELDINGSEKVTNTLDMPTGLTPVRFVGNQDEQVGNSWRVPFSSDGNTTGGGIQFQSDDRTWSLVVSPTDETIKDLDGPLPDFSYDTWPAGSNVPPTSS